VRRTVRFRLPRTEMKKARIEIIPMIDTIFFLLVFFMIASLAMTKMRGMPVQLPKSSVAKAKPAVQVMVTITAAGRFYIDKKPVAFDEIYGEIAARLRDDPQSVVVLNCDRRQHVEQLVHVMEEVKRANAQNVLIATEPRATAAAGAASGS
jgi:biopolymer transport protein ExbD